MMRLRQLNSSFKSILSNPFNQEAWGGFDLSCIYLNKDGYKFQKREDEFSCAYKTVRFSKKQQYGLVEIELTKAVEQQFFQYSIQVLKYRKNVLSKWWKVKKRNIKVYKTDYFVEKDGVIYFSLSGHPLLDLKFKRILKRRCKVETH